MPIAKAPWVLDSGGFSELSLYGSWQTSREQYVDEVRRYQEIGKLDWAAPQDWMCEPWLLAKTGLDVEEHQRRTIESFSYLRDQLGSVVAPVLQGWQLIDYHKHWIAYEREGHNLESELIVGLGSVCRRQGTDEITEVVQSLQPLRLHGFGVKLQGLTKFGNLLSSADSMAWSFDARRNQRLPNCTGHKNCANCIRYALRWRQKVLLAANL